MTSHYLETVLKANKKKSFLRGKNLFIQVSIIVNMFYTVKADVVLYFDFGSPLTCYVIINNICALHECLYTKRASLVCSQSGSRAKHLSDKTESSKT